jgi:hypothetical protein
MRNCASGNLEIPGSLRSPGMTANNDHIQQKGPGKTGAFDLS